MNRALSAIHGRRRLVLAAFVLLVLFGLNAYLTIPREADPDIQVPVYVVHVSLPGVSPEDADTLLVRPLEEKLRDLPFLKELTGIARENGATMIAEFEPEADAREAGRRVREKVDEARGDLPEDAEEPVVEEINFALMPAIVIAVSGDVPERTLHRHARRLADALEGLPGVLEARLSGHREEVTEVIIDDRLLESYGITHLELAQAVRRFNRLIPAGSIRLENGRLTVKAPGLFRSVADVRELPVKSVGGRVITLADIATARRTFKARRVHARVNGEPAMTIEVVKRVGANILDVVRAAKATATDVSANWPAPLRVHFVFDESRRIDTVIQSLENAILTAVFLVMLLCVLALGPRQALLVGISIPSAFLVAFAIMWLLGKTMNIMMLFGLVLTVGMLVDAAIVIVEFADRRMREQAAGAAARARGRDGMPSAMTLPQRAFSEAARRMFWPIATSTATTLAAFLPLLFWPGVTGKFMANLPITVVIVLSASLLVAMVVLPVLGGWLARPPAPRGVERDAFARLGALAREGGGDDGHLRAALAALPGMAGAYARFLTRLLRRPGLTLLMAAVILATVFVAYGRFNAGTEFFTRVEPDRIFVHVRARGNLSATERLRLVRAVEEQVRAVRGIDAVYTLAGFIGRLAIGAGGGLDQPRDVVGRLLVELKPLRARGRSGWEILEEIRLRARRVPGVIVEVQEFEEGPPTGKDVRLQVRAADWRAANEAAARVSARLARMEGFIDIEDERPLPGIERVLRVDRAEAGRFGADVVRLGTLVRMLTEGVRIGDYRPPDAEEKVEIRVRLPAPERAPSRLAELRMPTSRGDVPIVNFVRMETRPAVSTITRKDGLYSVYVKANVAPGHDAVERRAALQRWLEEREWPAGVRFRFRGADEERSKAQDFLGKALVAAVLIMFLILVAQFESFWHAALVLSTLLMSVAGALIGMLAMGQKFSIIMTGTGLVALAGIVVNNAIVLIDTHHINLRRGHAPDTAALLAAVQRLRPVLLTTITTIAGLLPMVFELDVNWVAGMVGIGSEMSSWWVQLSTAIVFGLAFATLLTLVLIPVLLALPYRWGRALRRLRARRVAGMEKGG